MSELSRSARNRLPTGDLNGRSDQVSAEPSRRAGQAAPAAVQLARVLLCLVALGHLLTLALLRTRSGGGPSAGAWELHTLLALLMAVFIWKLPTGNRWVRRPTTMSQLLSIGFSIVLWSSSINYRPLIPVLDAAGLFAVALLWLPNGSRFFFSVFLQRESDCPQRPRPVGIESVR